jgi:hypothetical protein
MRRQIEVRTKNHRIIINTDWSSIQDNKTRENPKQGPWESISTKSHKIPLNSVHINQLIVKMKHKTKLAKLILIYNRYSSPSKYKPVGRIITSNIQGLKFEF